MSEKKPKQYKEVIMLVERWDAFLKKIEERFKESLKMAEETILEEMKTSNYDVMPTMNAWIAMKSQISTLIDKIEKTWYDKVEQSFSDLKVDYNDYIEEYKSHQEVESRLNAQLEREGKKIEGKLAYAFYDHAKALMDKTFLCTQCGSPLKLNKNIFRSQYVACSSCNTVNTFEPETKIGEIEAFAIHKIVDYETINEWDMMTKAWNNLKSYRGVPPLTYWDNLEDAIRTYWTANLKERIQYQPEYEATFDKDLAYKMLHFYKEKQKRVKN